MKTKYFFLAAIGALTLASCSNDGFVGEDSQALLGAQGGDGSIQFSYNVPNATRANIGGGEAADILGNFFYVEGTKADVTATPKIPTSSPTTVPVFDNYFVQYTANTAGTTESNTANWEYVGKNPGSTPAGYPKLSSITGAQTIKYWDYSAPQYDFFAFSTGKATPVTTGSPSAGTPGNPGQVNVTKMNYGGTVTSNAYTFIVPSEEELKEVYITDITEVATANYGEEVQLRFKNLGSKIRLALYETVPGYAVSDVKFYIADANDVPTDLSSATKGTDATLISTDYIPTSGTILVTYPHVGSTSKAKPDADYNKASVTVTAGSGKVTYHGFGTLNYVAGENVLSGSASYLGTSLPNATFAGEENAKYYTTVFPVSSSNALTLRVDYTLTATDGSNEKIQVYGAKASVPATYTKWRPNYAYTYIFKISDATNGWTTTDATADNKGLYPITFDAVVAEVTDATAEQTTVTTVSTPSITTYQQGHDKSTDEYAKANTKAIYVQVMNTAVSPATLVTGLDASNSIVYELSANTTEAKVLDALVMRKTAVATANVVGRNKLELTKVTSGIDNTVTQIKNGVDDNPITGLSSGTVCEISNSALAAGKSYAYVYIPSASTEEIEQYEPIAVTTSPATQLSGDDEDTFYKLQNTLITNKLSVAEQPDDDYLYFTVTENGTGIKTYSYVSSIGKASIPAGYYKYAKADLTTTVQGDQNAEEGYFYFDKYITNNGKYAVKVIKIQ